MRKHDVRKWLHAVLDLLPVILIPVFMIYSHRHTIDSGSIVVPKNQVVDFNQQLKVLNNDNWYTNTANVSYLDNSVTFTATSLYGRFSTPVNFLSTHTYLISFYAYADDVSNFITASSSSYLNGPTVQTFINRISLTTNNTLFQSIFTCNFNTYYLNFIQMSNDYVTAYFSDIQLFDLTQMFGSGNEPTIQEFDQWYSQDYYDYTLSDKQLLKGISTFTYDDSDIMSQVVYQLYNSVDKYFNMGNVFNMTGVYDWFNLNIFNGNAPISIYIVWNIVLYEFVMDLLFLLYGLFMWFIDMVEKLMEKPLKSVK